MLKNYIITAFRNLSKNRSYALINVIGLALGIGCSLVIFKVLMYELSFDDHHSNGAYIYRVSSESIYPDRVDKGMGTPHPLGEAMRVEFPELREVVTTYLTGDIQIDVQRDSGEVEKFLIDQGVSFVDNSFFKVFDTEWIAGDKNTALVDPNTVVLAASTARQLFGLKDGNEAEAMGKTIRTEENFLVVGIIADPPTNTNLPFKVLFEYKSQASTNPYFFEGKEWNSTSSGNNTYILVDETFDKNAFDQKLTALIEKYYSKKEAESRKFVTQKFVDLHFDEEYGAYQRTLSISLLYAIGTIGLFLILTACINFVNLATAQASNRAKEIGIRKAIGGLTEQLIGQFMLEISMITFVSMIVALAIAEIMFIALEDIVGYRLMLDFYNDPGSLLFLLIVFIVVSFISGFYPAILLSKMNAILALKSKITSKHNSGGLSLRKSLVIFQFAISQFLIIGTLVVAAQTKFFQEKDLGFEKEAIVNTYLPDQDKTKLGRFETLMLQSPAIKDIAFGLSQPMGNSNSNSNINYAPLASARNYTASFKAVNERYFDFFGLELLSGRTLRDSDSTQIVINRKIAELMGFKNNLDSVVGETLDTGWGGAKQIVGVVDNFHNQPLNDEIDYLVFINVLRVFYSCSFKISSMNESKVALAHFEKSWEEVFPESVIDYSFYDDDLKESYETEEGILSLLQIFALISIFIGCLGLYGLISFIAINRTKEIGVRKVLGASTFSILRIFSKEILLLTLIAFGIAAPFGYIVMSAWLGEYVYRIGLTYDFFAVSFVITLAIAIVTIGHRAISSALVNPAQTLKDE